MNGHPFWRDERSVRLLGMGSALPGKNISTAELLEQMQVRFGLDLRRRGTAVAARLGILSRHVCRDFHRPREQPRAADTNANLAARALHAALHESGIDARDLAYLIAHTTTPDRLLPPNVAQVAELIGYDGPFVELRQACTGFSNALVMAFGLLHTPGCGPVAIVGSETGSVFFDPRRAATSSGQLVNLLQMGDGAGACILASCAGTSGARISNIYHGNVGRGREPGFELNGAGTYEFEHDYRRVREHGAALFVAGAWAAQTAGIPVKGVDFLIPHQANGHMAAHLSAALEIDGERVFVNADRIGNTGSAAIWLALQELRSTVRSGQSACVIGAEATKYMFGGFLYIHA